MENQIVYASTDKEINIANNSDITLGFTADLNEQKLLQEQITNKMGLIKEHKFSLNLLNVTKSEHTTPLINGILKGLIIETNKVVNLKIYLKNHPGIVLFESRQVINDNYIPLRVQSMTSDHKMFNFTTDEYVLNDELVIEVEGPTESEVNFSLRWI